MARVPIATARWPCRLVDYGSDWWLRLRAWSLAGLLVSCLVSCWYHDIETKAELIEQKDRGFLLVLDLAGFILGIIPGLLVLFLVSVDP